MKPLLRCMRACREKAGSRRSDCEDSSSNTAKVAKGSEEGKWRTWELELCMCSPGLSLSVAILLYDKAQSVRWSWFALSSWTSKFEESERGEPNGKKRMNGVRSYRHPSSIS